MSIWAIWVALGIICLIIEIFVPGFVFFGLGIGAIITGLTAGFTNIYIQLVIFAVSTTVSFLLMRRFASFILKKDNVQSNVFALHGKTGIVTGVILPNKKGVVKVESEEWSAVSQDETLTIPENSVVKVVGSEGNKLFVELG
jgi:membrane protein implicated in regulation of membrane protease activity